MTRLRRDFVASLNTMRQLQVDLKKNTDALIEELEKRIEREGVPSDNYEVWEDSIEWKNAVEEIEK